MFLLQSNYRDVAIRDTAHRKITSKAIFFLPLSQKYCDYGIPQHIVGRKKQADRQRGCVVAAD